MIAAEMSATKKHQNPFAPVRLEISGNCRGCELLCPRGGVSSRVGRGGYLLARLTQRQDVNAEGGGFPQKSPANLDLAGRAMKMQLRNDVASRDFLIRPAIEKRLLVSTDGIPANGKQPTISPQSFDQFPGRLESAGRTHRLARKINDVGVLDQSREFRVCGRNQR
ncbi:MAG: hypothetical protein QOJ05_921 [Verrucomicrobiota bacterium]